jgi:predicted transcriptional regulator
MAKRKLVIRIGATDADFKEFKDTWKRLERKEKVMLKYSLTFENWMTWLNVLTPKRWEMLAYLRRQGEMSIYSLAKKLNRDYKNVHTDVSELMELGLIERKDKKVFVPWDEIDAQLKLAA